ncbi:MAG: hypothetical protein ACHQSE_03490 [Gemmatimonadales bacterium]
MLRRSSPLFVLAFVALVAACNNFDSPQSKGTPVGVVLMNARTLASGYTTYPKVNFYAVGSATFTFSNTNSDTCIVAPYDSTATATGLPTRIGAGALMRITVEGDTDSLYKATTTDLTYTPTTLRGFAFVPGDSVSFQIAGDGAGFPPLTGQAPTAEPFTIAAPTPPPAGQAMSISWDAASDLNAAMYISLLYDARGDGTLNTQVFCDFRDDGQGSVQAYLIPALTSSSVPFVMRAQRVRSALLLTSGTGTLGYLNVISTFEVPTPVSP